MPKPISKNNFRQKLFAKRQNRVIFHHSFKRSYREDYMRNTNVPGIMQHIFMTFKIIFKNWKFFGSLLILAVLLNVALVGLLSQDTYKSYQNILDNSGAKIAGGDIGYVAKAGLLLLSSITTGGLTTEMTEVQGVFAAILSLLIWLVTIFALRHFVANKKIKLRDALYNACTPLISTFVVMLIIFIQCIPIILLVIAYAAAVTTNFFATPFYALVFFIFASLMIIISAYFLSSSLIALVAVTAPGVYPMKALHAASDLMASRRTKFILRIIALILTLGILVVLIMMPIILFDMWMKTFEWTANIPFVSFWLLLTSCFIMIYVSTYFYLYYRMMLDNE